MNFIQKLFTLKDYNVIAFYGNILILLIIIGLIVYLIIKLKIHEQVTKLFSYIIGGEKK